jgi:hypothetical protein
LQTSEYEHVSLEHEENEMMTWFSIVSKSDIKVKSNIFFYIIRCEMTEPYYFVRYKNNQFKASILLPEKVMEEDDQQCYIGFGGQYKCISITITENDTIAWLSGLKHNKKCLINAPLKRGKDGTVMMLKTAIAFVKNMYPFVKYIYLTDTSDIRLRNGNTTSLIAYYIIKYNTSWYGKHLDAIPEKKEDIKKLIKLLDCNKEKSKYKNYQQFFDKNISSYNECISDDVFNTLRTNVKIREQFVSSKTIREFLMFLNSEYGIEIYQSWLTGFFASIYGTTWKIDVKHISGVNLRIEQTDQGFLRPKRVKYFNSMIGGTHHIALNFS